MNGSPIRTPNARVRQATIARAVAPRIRIENGGTRLGALGWVSFDAFRPTTTTTTTTTAPAPAPAPAPTSPTGTLQPVYTAPTAPAPVYTEQLTLAPAPAPAPTSQPITAPAPIVYEPQGSGSSQPTAGEIATAAAGLLAPISPATAAAAALAPAVVSAASAEPMMQLRMTDDPLDFNAPELYDANGKPLTTTAKVASITETIKNLPTPAKIGGAVLLYLLFARGR